jgi:hypothetical protein
LDQTQGETVSKIRIDDLALPRCALIKMDVEGMEIDVIRGATKTITTHHPLLFVENNRPKGSPELVEALSDLGYKCWWHIASYFNPNNFFQNERNIFPDVPRKQTCFASTNRDQRTSTCRWFWTRMIIG